MVVVVRDRVSSWAVLAVTVLVLIVVGILVFLITGGRVLVVALPGFPPESILVGLAAGVVLIVLKRKRKLGSSKS